MKMLESASGSAYNEEVKSQENSDRRADVNLNVGINRNKSSSVEKNIVYTSQKKKPSKLRRKKI